MRMVQKILAPGVEHAQTPDHGAEMLRVRGDLEQRGRARAEEQVVHDRFVLEREPREIMRQREDHMVIADGQEFVLPGRQPLIAGVRQTFSTVPIPTRVVRDGAMVTARAAIEMATQRRRAAARQGAEHASVLAGQPGSVCLDEALAVLPDDVSHLEGWPGHRFCNRRERRAVSGPDTGIASNGFATACRWRRERCR